MPNYTSANAKLWARMGSCGVFGLAAMELPASDERVRMLTADLCTFSGLTRFSVQFPDKFFNMGIAEQNMLGVAAGLAHEGLIPFVTTYASFASMRIVDQVRVCMGYMQLPIKLVGLTAGLSSGILGPTHMAIEDIAVMRAIPHVTVLSPADCMETIKVTLAAAQYPGPVYIRCTGSMGAPAVYNEDYEFQIGKAITLRTGRDISIIATGTMVSVALDAASLLAERDIDCSVVNMHTIKPVDKKAVQEAAAHKLVVSVEEHSRIGGLGGAIAEEMAAQTDQPPLLVLGIDDEYPHAGSYAHLLEKCGLTPEAIATQIEKKWISIMV